MDEWKEAWLKRMPLDDAQAHDPDCWPMQAAKLIRAYEEGREEMRRLLKLAETLHPAAGVRDSIFTAKENDLIDTEWAIDNAWKEALNAE